VRAGRTKGGVVGVAYRSIKEIGLCTQAQMFERQVTEQLTRLRLHGGGLSCTAGTRDPVYILSANPADTEQGVTVAVDLCFCAARAAWVELEMRGWCGPAQPFRT